MSETLRNGVRAVGRDGGQRPGPATAERGRIKVLEREARELRQVNEILRQARAYCAQAALDRPFKQCSPSLTIIASPTRSSQSCHVLLIALSTCRVHAAWRADPLWLPAHNQRDADLQAVIRRVHEANFGVYGARKPWRQLAWEGVVAARCTVARLMRGMGLRRAVRERKGRTMIADKAVPCPADKADRRQAIRPPSALAATKTRCPHVLA